jgi:hypothetical protein
MRRPRLETLLVLALMAFAAGRIFVFCAAFPYFNNMDEVGHFDVVISYSRGVVPRALEPHTPQLRRWIRNWSPEFLSTPDVYLQPQKIVRKSVPEAVKSYAKQMRVERNHELLEPPLYYGVAAVWLSVGELLRVSDDHMFYWVRFLNVLLGAATVWLAYVVARNLFPDRPFLKIAPPALLAFIPQDVLYGVNSDVLSPLSCGVICLGLVHWLNAERNVLGAAALTGAGVAVAGLTKLANVPLIAVTLLTVAYLVLWSEGRGRRPLATTLIFATCASPLAAWLIWNKLTLGNFTGSAAKLEYLGFKTKPLADWFHHPLYGPTGIKDFWFELIASYWRGEITWHRKPIANYWVDCVYAWSTLVAIVAATVGLARKLEDRQRVFLVFGLASFWASVAFLATASVALDYGQMGSPSPLFAFPGFVSGRLMCGTLIPFAIVFAYGIDTLCPRRHANACSFIILAALCTMITASEIWLHTLVFQSSWNLFHNW